jgi:hypothetical protein
VKSLVHSQTNSYNKITAIDHLLHQCIFDNFVNSATTYNSEFLLARNKNF